MGENSNEYGRQAPLTIKELDQIATSARAQNADAPPPLELTNEVGSRHPWRPIWLATATTMALFAVVIALGVIEQPQDPIIAWNTHVEETTQQLSPEDVRRLIQPIEPTISPAPEPLPKDSNTPSEAPIDAKAADSDAFAVALDCSRKRASFICIDQHLRHQSDKSHIEAYTLLADAFRVQGKQTAAIEAWTFLIGLRPREAKYYNARCWQRFVSNRELQEGLADCTKALSLAPDNANTLDSRGSILVRLGRYNEAIADFSASLAKAEYNAHAIYGRGLARLRLGETDAAKHDIDSARAMASAIDRGFWMDDFGDGV